MRAALLLIAAVTLAASGARPNLEPTQVEACESEGGCVYVSRQWLTQRMADSRERGRREAKDQCGERTGVVN